MVIPKNTLAGLSIDDPCVDPCLQAHVWIASSADLLETRYGGQTVRRVLTGRCWSVQINAGNPAEIIACTHLGGTQDNGTLRSGVNQGWDQVAQGDGGDCAVVETPRPCCYHSYYDMYIERAFLDGYAGLRWANVSPGVPDDYLSLFYPPMDALGPLLAKAGVSLWVSQDQGEHWDEVLFQLVNDASASAITILSPTTILLGTEAGTIFRIRRTSAHWGNAKVEPLASPRDGSISDLVTGGASGTLWASCSFVGDLILHEGTRKLRAGTRSRGVWEVSI